MGAGSRLRSKAPRRIEHVGAYHSVAGRRFPISRHADYDAGKLALHEGSSGKAVGSRRSLHGNVLSEFTFRTERRSAIR